MAGKILESWSEGLAGHGWRDSWVMVGGISRSWSERFSGEGLRGHQCMSERLHLKYARSCLH
eukprot:365817-Chlamydomonas_euryale.AAC.26